MDWFYGGKFDYMWKIQLLKAKISHFKIVGDKSKVSN